MGFLLLAILLGAGDWGWGDDPDTVDGCRRVTEVDLAATPALRGRRVYLDGVFGGAARERVRLRASRVELLPSGSAFEPERFRSFQRDANVRVFGVVARIDPNPAITVDRISRQPDDGQRYHRARQRIRDHDATGLYALADRLRARHQRYGREYLERWARDVTAEAVEAELGALREQPKRLYDLAERARSLVADESLRTRILGAALKAERKALPDMDSAARNRLADKWEQLLPKRPEPRALRREGLLIEEGRLAAGDAQACYALARRFEILVQDAAHARVLNRRGLAAEEAALGAFDYAGRYRLSKKVGDLALDAVSSHRLLAQGAAIERRQLAGRPYEAYVRLAERYARDLHDVTARDEIVRQGLAVQKGRLDPRDLNGHLALAHEYLARLGDRAGCVERLLHCITLVPDEARVRARLKELGMMEVAGRWHETRAVVSDPKLAWEARIERTIAAGQIELGMTPEHVRRAWGEPVRRNAVFTRGARTVQWVYSGVRATRVVFRNRRVVAWSR